jgi:dipeptidyl-peptidase 4
MKANYELAARWTSSKVAKLVFDMAVTPHWLADGNRFWYSYENSAGRKFYVVDPVKKTKTFVFDAVKLAASLTTATGLPYDSQHLPITTIRYVKNDGSIQFEINVPKDAIIPGEKKTTVTTSTDAKCKQNDEADDNGQPQQQGGRGGVAEAPPPAGRRNSSPSSTN